jgi:release factor glutamine methyltransferase
LSEGTASLEIGGIGSPRQDAEVLLAHVLDVARARLHAHPEIDVPPADARRFRALVERRASHEPLQHLTGVQEFWSLAFRVTPAVLIPRPETELVVETCVALNDRPDPRVVDIGTGSGCIAVSVAREVPGADVHATDCSAAALKVARGNGAAHGVADRIRFAQGDLFEPLSGLELEGRFDFILCNPPYVASSELSTLQEEVRDYEPLVALSPGDDPLAVHRRLVEGAARYLRRGGFLLVEIAWCQEEAVRSLYTGRRDLEIVEVKKDLAGIPRLVVARAPGIPGEGGC